MRTLALIVLGCLSLEGCAEPEVERRTEHYTATIGSIEDEIVLDNLSRFIDDEDRLPTQIDLKQGQTVGTDNINLGLSVPYTHGLSGTSVTKSPRVFSISAAQFSSADQWVYVPVTDVDDLTRVRCLYKYAIEQSKRQSEKFETWALFIKGGKQHHSCAIVDGTVFKYPPPDSVWLKWDDNFDPALLDLADDPWKEIGIYESHKLYVRPAEFHNFELAVLGSMPNTTGAAGSATTSKAPAPPSLNLAIFGPTSFTKSGESIPVTFYVANLGDIAISNVVVKDDNFPILNCKRGIINPGDQFECSAQYTITDDDFKAQRFETSAIVSGEPLGGNLIRASFDLKIPKAGALKAEATSAGAQELPEIKLNRRSLSTETGVSYPQFYPGKSSAPITEAPQPPP